MRTKWSLKARGIVIEAQATVLLLLCMRDQGSCVVYKTLSMTIADKKLCWPNGLWPTFKYRICFRISLCYICWNKQVCGVGETTMVAMCCACRRYPECRTSAPLNMVHLNDACYSEEWKLPSLSSCSSCNSCQWFCLANCLADLKLVQQTQQRGPSF